MFNILILLIAVINLANSQESPEADDVAILSGLSTAALKCSLNFDREFVAENDAIAAVVEELFAQREIADVTREPREHRERKRDGADVVEEAEATEAPTDVAPRRNLRNRGNRRDRQRGDDVTSEPLEDDSTREPKDATREPRERKSRGDRSTREPCDDDKADVTGEAEATEAPADLELRRNLRAGRGNGRDRRRGDGDVTSDDSTREPRDVTREPCNEDEDATEAPLLRRLLRRGGDRTREPRDDSTKEPCDRTREPCVGDDCNRERKGRKGGRKTRKGKDVTTEAPEDVPELRRALGRNGGRNRRKGLDATISNGIVDIAGVTGEVVFGDVDETLESIPLTLTVGETVFQCNVEVKRGNKVSCIAVSGDDFRVRVGCELEL